MKINLKENQVVQIYIRKDECAFTINNNEYVEKISCMKLASTNDAVDKEFPKSVARKLWKNTVGIGGNDYQLLTDLEVEVNNK